MSTKLPTHLDNPLDVVFYRLGLVTLPFLKIIGATPNMLTGVGALCVLFYLCFLYEERYLWAVAFYVVAYWFDCVDGQFARHYKMTSKFGDMLDHSVDLLRNCGTLVLVLFFMSWSINDKCIFVLGFTILSIGNIYFCNCQQQYYKGLQTVDGHFMDYIGQMCKNNTERHLAISRYVGPGTKQAYILAFFIYIATKSCMK